MSTANEPAPEIMAFIAELEALSQRTKIVIGGCGCCGSPRLDRWTKDTPPVYRYHTSRDGEVEELAAEASPVTT